MKILLTGAAGFIGSHLATRLLTRGDAVVGLDNFDETLYAAALHQRNLETISGERFRFVPGDFLDAPLLDSLAAEKPDAIVHLGGLAGVRPSIAFPHRYQKVNIEGTLNVLEACRQHGIKRLVFASSSSVYGKSASVPFRENDPADRPVSPYAATKRAGELLCANYQDLYGISTNALRFFTVYGPRQRPEMAIHKFAQLIRDGKPVPIFGDGSTARDYTFIDDIIDGVVAAIDATGRTPGYHVYNLGGSRTTKLGELIKLIENGLGKIAQIDRQPDQPGDVPLTWADPSLAQKEIGYSPKVGIEEGIARFCAWFKLQK